MWRREKRHAFYLLSDCRRVHISATLAEASRFPIAAIAVAASMGKKRSPYKQKMAPA